MSFDPSGSTLLVAGIPIRDSRIAIERCEDTSVSFPPAVMNEGAAARAQMTRAELYQEVRIRLAGSAGLPNGPARRTLVQRTILGILFERYELECRLDAALGEEKSE